MNCPACGTENRPGRRFCAHCGAALEATCPSCGAANEPGDRFCGECGSSLAAAARTSDAARASAPSPVSERRLVSVLFADLVGFATLTKHRDPEEVPELLSMSFDRYRSVTDSFGVPVEKF